MNGERRAARAGRPGRPGDRGSAAVEFALLLPLLLFMVCGIVDFGRALNAQITLTQAAREGVRLESLADSNSAVQTGAESAGTGLSLTASNVDIVDTCTSSSTASSSAEVEVTYTFSFITPIGAVAKLVGGSSSLGNNISMSATGVEPCES